MNEYTLQIASNPEEVKTAQRLRFEIFNLEVKGELKSSVTQELDKDEYDPFCDHLLIIEPEKKKVIGTYRMLLRSKAKNSIGFYSESKFDISNIKKLDSQMLELGRACIHRDYRNKNVLDLLWQGVAEYILKHNVEYVFGCPGIRTRDSRKISEIFSYVKENYYSDEKLRVYPLEKNKLRDLDLNYKAKNNTFRKIPPLIQSYLKIGAWICGYPAINPEFNTTALFMLLDVGRISDTYRKHFFNNPAPK